MQIDKAKFVSSLSGAVDGLSAAAAFGREIAKDIDRIYFVSCGAPNRTMLGLQYWIEAISPSIEVRRYFPAEFMDMNPPRMNERTLVVLASKSGTTKETLAAANFVKDKPCKTVAVTQHADLPLAQLVDHVFFTGKTNDAYFGCFMLLQALVGGVLAEKDQWPLLDKLVVSLANLPTVLADAAIASSDRGLKEASAFLNDQILYHLGSGPMFTAAYVHGTCVLAESQWLHSHALEAAEFFHGPFEIIDETTPLMLYLGEDPSRPQMERVVTFCQKYTSRLMIYDSKDFPMEGIAPEIRAIVAPYVVGIAAEQFAYHLSVLKNQPLTTRRYMWKTEY
ncbi:SIS domain-containing protein [Leeia sp. TBRC 13508]|uniref:SIS domain-containing protein n=1 Tax=Leeia speluncae TaxID=2884804 RepID=A0ABS8D971_9NEIS|nr:SIS domain-containing protein [Leeia speluncae]MCB6184573.1 SIS domain-containing protein [Leeia speluncae]